MGHLPTDGPLGASMSDHVMDVWESGVAVYLTPSLPYRAILLPYSDQLGDIGWGWQNYIFTPDQLAALIQAAEARGAANVKKSGD